MRTEVWNITRSQHSLLMNECRECRKRALLSLEPSVTANMRLRMPLQIALASAMITTYGEPRIAHSLAHVRGARGRNDDTRQMLGPVHDRFREGFGTADLRATRPMLDTLAARWSFRSV